MLVVAVVPVVVVVVVSVLITAFVVGVFHILGKAFTHVHMCNDPSAAFSNQKQVRL